MTWVELQQCVGTGHEAKAPVWVNLEHVVKIDFAGVEKSSVAFQAARVWLVGGEVIETRDGGDIETLRKYLRRSGQER